MSRNGQIANRDPINEALPRGVNFDCPRALIAFSRNIRNAFVTPLHAHPRGQLLYAAHGTLTTTAEDGTWVAPPERAIWIPAGVPHVTSHSFGTELCSIFVQTNAARGLPSRCAVLQVSPLLRELLLAVIRLPALYNERGADGRLVRTLFDRFTALPDEPLHLPLPVMPKLRAIAVDYARRPGVRLPLTKAARSAAMSPRSFARHFHSESGMTFGAWQRQARLLRALELLGTGANVSTVAFAVGYESPSAFIAVFRRAFGKTPAQYFAGSN